MRSKIDIQEVFLDKKNKLQRKVKSELKQTGGGGVKPICRFALWKKLPDFQTAGKVLSDKLLGSR